MTGPQPSGTWTLHKEPAPWGMLLPGHAYRVTQSFRDYDGTTHPVGEQWDFLGFNFLPYDDGLSLFVTFDGTQEWHIRMQLRPEEQEQIMHDFSQYVAAFDPIVIPTDPTHPAMPPLSNRLTYLMLAASLLALVLSFVVLHLNHDSTGSVPPTLSAIVCGLAVLAGGMLLGLVAIVRLVLPRPIQRKKGPPSTR